MASTALPEVGEPGRHPEPPPDLGRRELPIWVADTRTTFVRLHTLDRGALAGSVTGEGRFNSPEHDFGVVYAGMDVHAAFIETFGRQLGIQLVTTGELQSRGLAQISLLRRMRLVDLTGAGLASLGADARLCTGDYAMAQRWSQAFWAHPTAPDGLVWRSRFDPSRKCVAIFNRAVLDGAISVTDLGTLFHLRHRELLRDLLDTYQFGLLGG